MTTMQSQEDYYNKLKAMAATMELYSNALGNLVEPIINVSSSVEQFKESQYVLFDQLDSIDPTNFDSLVQNALAQIRLFKQHIDTMANLVLHKSDVEQIDKAIMQGLW